VSERNDETRRLVDRLVADLAPVKRVPALGVALAIVLGAWLVFGLLAAWVHRPLLDVAGQIAAEPWVGLVVVGLALGALAATVAALAGVVPGREPVERRAATLAWAGVALATSVGAVATLLGVGRGLTAPSHDAACFALAVTVGLGPLAALVALERRGLVARVERGARLTLLAGFGLGGLAVQLVCHEPGARHLLFGHVLVPTVMLALGVLPLAWLLRRLARHDGPTA